MEYVIEIKINHNNIGCNSRSVEIIVDDSKMGAIALAKYFKKTLGDVSVVLWKDTSITEYTKLSSY